jgi:SlyX protein
MTQDTDERIIRLEMLVAEQERTIAELSEQLSEQWSLTEKMRKKLDALTERFLALEEQTAPDTPVTKPPHY